MNHLGFKIDKMKIGSFDFTCCEGCQLQLANKESTLPDFLGLLDVRNFREISSEQHDDYDIALVEGSITRSDEIERLKAIRAQASVLVAFGSCACFGGVNSLPIYPVCVDCKQRLNTCLFDLGEVCLGPITKAGCDAVCPSGKTPCLGCRGPADEINFPSFLQLVKEKGLSEDDMREKLTFYNGFADYLDHES